MKNDLKKIKRYYGEDMMHLCRELFPTILEEDGTLLRIIEDTFPHSKFLYDDIVKDNQIETFKDYIYDKYDNQENDKTESETYISPFSLMDRAGYTLYECHTESDIQKFKKYYAEDEELCTFAGGRLDHSIVFFAVKKNVNDIKRENFPNPMRQDEYGTSVISIQYRRGARNTLSIKNRYNHTVDNPDATFGNNLDNIIPGLNDSFERTYNLSHTGSREKFELSKYIRAVDGKYYKYNLEVNGVYFGPNNIVIDNFEVIERYKEKEKYLIIDNIVIDLIDKKIYAYDNSDKYIENLNDICKIEVSKIPTTDDKEIVLIMYNGDKVLFKVNKFNRIVKIIDNYTLKIPDDSLLYSEYLKELSMPKVSECGDRFLLNNAVLNKIEMPSVVCIGNNFLRINVCLREVNFPKLQIVGDFFIRINDLIKELYLPNLEIIGNNFMDLNRMVETVCLPNVKMVGGWFLSMNNKLTNVNMPKVERISDNFLSNNKRIKSIYFPNLMYIGNNFFSESMAVDVNLPNVLEIGNRFMSNNFIIEKIALPNVIKIGDYFISGNRVINCINFPNLVIIGDGFLKENDELDEIILPNLELCGADFMMYNHKVNNIYMPKIECLGDRFLWYNYQYRDIVLGSMEQVEVETGKKYVRKR